MAFDSPLFMEQKTILIVRPNDNIGGSQRMAETYNAALAEIGYNVVMITLTGEHKGTQKNNRDIALNKSRSLFAILQLRKIIDSLQPDIILGFQFQVNIVLSILSLVNPMKKWIYLLRESNLQNYINNGGLHRTAVRFTYLMSDRIIAQCTDMKNHIIRHYGVTDNKIKVIYNYPEYMDKGFVARQNILMVASTLSKQKNIKGALNLWAAQDCHDELHIYGYNKTRLKDLQEYVERCNISNVIFKGLADIIPYEAYKLLLITSFYEGFSNAVLESLSCGTPVLAKKYEGGIAEVINESNGVIYAFEDSVDIASIADHNWDYSSIRKNAKNTFNKSKFKSCCEKVFTV